MSKDQPTTDLTASGDPRAWLEQSAKDPARAEALWNRLEFARRKDIILAARGRQREELILMAQDARRLVMSLAPDDFARTIFELGPEDAGGLLELCSPTQMTYVMDLTGWVREKFAPARYQFWVPVILDGGAGPLNRWLKSADVEVLALLFAHWFKVVKWLPSQEEQEPPDDLPGFTLDGIYFLTFHNDKIAQVAAQVLVQLKSEQPERYTRVLETMLWEPASQLASDALRWRNGRLLDHGVPERAEALELWAQPLPGEEKWQSAAPKDSVPFFAGAPQRSTEVLELLPPSAALPALGRELAQSGSQWILAEAAFIANCGVVALDADPADPEQVARSARESLGLVNLGLGLMAQKESADPGAILGRMPMAALARQGARAIRELNLAAHKLLNQGWLKGLPTGLHILDDPLDRVLAGLIFPRPRFYDPALPQDKEYRAFLSLADLEQARHGLDQAIYWGKLILELIGVKRTELAALVVGEVYPADPLEVKLSAVLGTWLARRALGLEGLAPIGVSELAPALAALKDGLAGPLAKELTESCQGLADPEEAAMAGDLLRGALERLRRELSGISPEVEPNPEFMAGLIVERG